MANQPHDDPTRWITTGASQSPEAGAVPFWITACVRLLKPGPRSKSNPAASDKVLTVVQMLDADRIKVVGDEAFELDRNAIADMAGYVGGDRAKRAGWIVTFLQRIGYLQVHERRSASTGRRLADQFHVSARPPANYVGPRTLAETVRALREERTWDWADLFPQVGAGVSGDNLTDEPRLPGDNHGEFPQVGAGVSGDNLTDEPRLPGDNHGEFPQVGAGVSGDTLTDEPYIGDLSEISVGEISERESEGATPPRSARRATPRQDDTGVDWARRLVRRLPWQAKGCRPPSRRDATELVTRFHAAVEAGLSQDDVQAYALERLAVADARRNPVAWVTRAFDPSRLPQPGFAASQQPEPLDDSPLPLPDLHAPGNGPDSAAERPTDLDGSSGPRKASPTPENRSQPAASDVAGHERPEPGAAEESGEPPASAEIRRAHLSAVAQRAEAKRLLRLRSAAPESPAASV